MKNLNSDVQANHGLMLSIENAKHHWETYIENLNGVFAITNDNFDILFCNKKLASLLDLTIYNYFRKNLRPLFSESDLNLLTEGLKELKIAPQNTYKTFEINLRSHTNTCPYILIISIFPMPTSEGRLYSVFGQDLSALKNSERRLNGVFSAIPLGVITLAEGGLIEDRYSQRSIDIIGQSSIIGKKLMDTLMSDAQDELFLAELKAIENLNQVIGSPVTTYENLTKDLPSELHSIRENEEGRIVERWLSVQYKPVVNNDIVERIIVVFDDKTQWVMMEREKAKLGLLEDDIVRRLFQVRSVSPEYATTMKDEIGTLMLSAKNAFEKSDRKDILRALHALKGNFRAVDFNDLSKMVHDLEESVLSKELKYEKDWVDTKAQFEPIETEWSAVDRTIDFARNEGNRVKGQIEQEIKSETLDNWHLISGSLEKISKHIQYAARLFDTELLVIKVKNQSIIFLNSLENSIREQFRRVLNTTGKKSELIFDWDNIIVSRSTSSLVRETLLHLLNNAIDHGLETEGERIAYSKNPIGRIKISATISKEKHLHLVVSDDGRGINLESLKERAIEKGIVTSEKASTLSRNEVMGLIFKPEFSTKTEVTEISGRGIGLDSVVSSLQSANGKISVDSKMGEGSTFAFDLFAGYQFCVTRQCITTSKFIGTFDEMVTFLKEQNISDITFVPQLTHSHESQDTILCVDAAKLIVAIILKCICCYGSKVGIGLVRIGTNLRFDFNCSCTDGNPVDLKFIECNNLLKDLYFSDVIQQHNGEWKLKADGTIDYLIIKDVFIDDFHLTVAFSRSFSQQESTAFYNRLEKIVKSLYGNIDLLTHPTAKLDLWVSNESSDPKITTLRTFSSDSVLENNILNRLTRKILHS
jgi:PAS domain-containing protein